MFSAKETLYKAYFPLTEVFIGFRDAEIALHPEAERGALRGAARARRAPDAAGRREFTGRFPIDAERILDRPRDLTAPRHWIRTRPAKPSS